MIMMKKNDDTYDINSGKHYSDMEYIRLRPRFYLGNQVYLTAVREVTDNAFDEIIKGYATTITVTFHKDGSISVRRRTRRNERYRVLSWTTPRWKQL